MGEKQLSQTYNWTRFWCPREGQLRLEGGGYLIDPLTEYGSVYNPDVKAFPDIENVRCLLLLGEPGMGKSHELEALAGALRDKGDDSPDDVLHFQLRDYTSDARLCDRIFGSGGFRRWREGEHHLHLFLDSLDEGLLSVEALGTIIPAELRGCPVERLLLRIACRTAECPTVLEDGLRELWGDENVRAYELAPLRQSDVAEAARRSTEDPEGFTRQVGEREVVPLAARPVTLRFLMATYSKQGRLPSSRAKLYEEGCRLLCTETNSSRIASGRKRDLIPDQCLVVAGRVAATTVFANRSAIWTAADSSDVAGSDVTVSELSGGRETVGGIEYEVTEDVVRQAIQTALFSARGPGRMGWTHQTHAEFLAGWYLAHHNVSADQIMGLIGDALGRVAPQLHEAAAWMAGREANVFRRIIESDPEVLLRSDVATADEDDRARLVRSLLNGYEDGTLLDTDWDLRKLYHKLRHRDLAEQLRPYIQGGTESVVVRRVAVIMALECDLRELQQELLCVALNQSEPVAIRKYAACAVCAVGDEDAKSRLRPLAMGEAGEDPQADLRGCGLTAVWPRHLSVPELLAAIAHPEPDRWCGMYASFLAGDIAGGIDPQDLPLVLRWIQGNTPRSPVSRLREFIDSVVTSGLDNLSVPGVLDALAALALHRFEECRDLVLADEGRKRIQEKLDGEPDIRRNLLSAIVATVGDPSDPPFYLHASGLAQSRDLPWMVQQLPGCQSGDAEQAWCRVIERTYEISSAAHTNGILMASRSCPALAEHFDWLVSPVRLDSLQAEEMRQRHSEMQKWQRPTGPPPLLDPPPAQRIQQLLDEFQKGDVDAWWRMILQMTLEPDSTDYGSDFEADLTSLPGWKRADDGTKRKIAEAAHAYLMRGNPDTADWLGTGELHRPALAGYKALRLLLGESPEVLSQLSSEVWGRWAPAIVAYPMTSSVDDRNPWKDLLRLSYDKAPDETLEALLAMIDRESQERDQLFITVDLEDFCDERLGEALLQRARDENLKPGCMGSLLSVLLAAGFAPGRAFAESLIPCPPPQEERERTRATTAAKEMVEHASDAGWAVVWPAMQHDADFGRALVEDVAYCGSEGRALLARLHEAELADFYIWLAGQYPHQEDREDDSGPATPRDMVAHLRDSVLVVLRNRGTHDACTAVRRIMERFPQLDLRWTLYAAQVSFRQKTWRPLTPSQVIELAQRAEARVIQNGDQLLDVVVESIRRLEAELHGDLTQVQFLWNGDWPGDEAKLCDYVATHLRRDLKDNGVVVNREVQIHRGKRTDIHVDAIVLDSNGRPSDTIALIIEAKGCWNRELLTAMETQLVDRYLTDNPCEHGLYLVAWFQCQRWNEDDDRKRRVPVDSIPELEDMLDQQATHLSCSCGKTVRAVVVDTTLR